MIKIKTEKNGLLFENFLDIRLHFQILFFYKNNYCFFRAVYAWGNNLPCVFLKYIL